MYSLKKIATILILGGMLASCETKKQAEDENQEQETKELLGSDAEIKDNQRVYFISPEDAKQAGIAEEIEVQDHWDFSYYEKVKKEVDTHITKYFDDEQFPILPQRAVSQIRELLPDDGIVTLDNGVYKIWFARNYKCYQPNTLLLDNALATMARSKE